jgi:putative ABC transport system ATP-binding protein
MKQASAKNPPESEALIQLRNISFAYGKRKILDDITLSFGVGTFSVIAGESGSGKSTLLYLLGGFQRPASGEYVFAGKPVYRRWSEFGLGSFRKKNIGFLFQDFRLLPFLTVEQNIRFPTYFSGRPFDKQSMRGKMEKLGILHRAKAFPTAISGGEAQRTGLARALLTDPPVLLLDEPTGNLDRATEAAIVEVLKELRNSGLTLICVSHSSYIMDSADTVYDLKDGHLTQRVRSRKKSSKEISP